MDSADAADAADGGPFSYLRRDDGSIVIRYREAPVTLLRGKSALRFATRVEAADSSAAQLLMARAATARRAAPTKR